jgi:PAS domain S-box-containing protein
MMMDRENGDDGGQFRSLADQLPAVVWSTDTQLRITSGSGGGLAALGLRRNEIVGVALTTYLGTQDDQHVVLRAHRRALLGESSRYEMEWSGRWYDTYVEPFRDADDAIIGTIAMAIDMTERKLAENERAGLQEQLRRQHRLEAIGQLASGLAHEINNPLQSIINFAQLIRARSQDPSTCEYADGISHEVKSLAAIVRNLQCLVHPKADLPVELRLGELVHGIVSLFGTLLRKDGIELDLQIPDELRPAWGNAHGVQQVLINLLMAARDGLSRLPPEDTAPRRIAIRAQAIDGPARRSLQLSVEHRHVCQDHERGAAVRGDERDLGIALSQEIAHLNAGDLRVETGPDQHRAFLFTLPFASEQ